MKTKEINLVKETYTKEEVKKIINDIIYFNEVYEMIYVR